MTGTPLDNLCAIPLSIFQCLHSFTLTDSVQQVSHYAVVEHQAFAAHYAVVTTSILLKLSSVSEQGTH